MGLLPKFGSKKHNPARDEPQPDLPTVEPDPVPVPVEAGSPVVTKLVNLAPLDSNSPVPAAAEAPPLDRLLTGPDQAAAQTDDGSGDDDLGDLLDVFKDEEVEIDPRVSTLAEAVDAPGVRELLAEIAELQRSFSDLVP